MPLRLLLGTPSVVVLSAIVGLSIWIYLLRGGKSTPKGLRKVPGPRGLPVGM